MVADAVAVVRLSHVDVPAPPTAAVAVEGVDELVEPANS